MFLTYLSYLIFGIVLIQFGYLIFYTNLLYYSPSKLKLPSKLPPVSVIVCAHNELEQLKILLPQLLAQKYSDFEVILVDDRSTDGTFDFFDYHYNGNSTLRLLRVAEKSRDCSPKKFALSYGVNHARFEALLFTDADCLPSSSNWIQQMAESMTEGKSIVLGISPYREKKGWLNLLIQYETFLTAIRYLSFAISGNAFMGVGRNLMYKKSLFLSKGGFGAHAQVLGGDDDLFVNEAATPTNVTCAIDKDSHMVSIPKETYREWLVQKRRHLSVGGHYKKLHLLFLGLETIAHLLFYPLVVFFIWVDFTNGLFILIGRSLVFTLIFALIARKMGITSRVWTLFFIVDCLFIFNYLIIVLSLGLYKRVKWN